MLGNVPILKMGKVGLGGVITNLLEVAELVHGRAGIKL